MKGKVGLLILLLFFCLTLCFFYLSSNKVKELNMYQLWDLYLNDCWSYSNIMYCQFQFVYKEELNNRISTSVNWDFFIGEFADSHYKSLEKRSKVKWLYCEAVKSVQFNNYLIKHDDKRYFPKYLGNCNQ